MTSFQGLAVCEKKEKNLFIFDLNRFLGSQSEAVNNENEIKSVVVCSQVPSLGPSRDKILFGVGIRE